MVERVIHGSTKLFKSELNTIGNMKEGRTRPIMKEGIQYTLINRKKKKKRSRISIKIDLFINSCSETEIDS